ncbi:hypothetical protein ACLOJK_036038 [Asimina triloba]
MRGERLCAISICVLLGLSLTFPPLAFSQSRVRYLPGFPGPLPFHLETGYIGVGESDAHQLFYYFVESERNPKEDPLVLWLTGGPGCSAWSGLVYEIVSDHGFPGPLYFEYAHYDGSLPRLKLREHSWTKVSNIIFVDSPVPTGFSYFSNSAENYVGNDLKSPKEVYQFLVKWLIAHPQFLSNPLYIGGDSYNGLILPPVVYYVANGIEAGKEPILNLKLAIKTYPSDRSLIQLYIIICTQGYLLGNPKTHRPIDDGSFVPFVHRMNLISDELYESVRKSCGGVYWHPTDSKCIKDIEAVKAMIAGIDVEHILEPLCPFVSPKPPLVGHGRLLDDNLIGPHLPDTLPGFGCREYWYLLAYYWANDANVRKALYVSEVYNPSVPSEHA